MNLLFPSLKLFDGLQQRTKDEAGGLFGGCMQSASDDVSQNSYRQQR